MELEVQKKKVRTKRKFILPDKNLYSDPDHKKLGGERFEVVKHDWIDSREYRIDHRNTEAVLYYLKRTAVKFPSNHDLGLHKRFYTQGYIVSSKSLRDLAYAFGYKGMTHMRRIINSLVKTGEIYIANVNVGKAKPQNVYVLGIHNSLKHNNYEELFFTELKYSAKLDKSIDSYLTEFSVNKKIIKW